SVPRMLAPSRCQPDRTLGSRETLAQSLLRPPARQGIAEPAPTHSRAKRFHWSEPRQATTGTRRRFAGSQREISLGLSRKKPASERTQVFKPNRLSGAGPPAPCFGGFFQITSFPPGEIGSGISK